MSVSRTSFASPPVQGTIDVTFNGVTKSGNISVKSDFFLFISKVFFSTTTDKDLSDYGSILRKFYVLQQNLKIQAWKLDQV